MECMIPGRVLISPAEHSISDLAPQISERIGLPFNLEYSIEDVLRRYEIGIGSDDLRRRFGPLPQIGRVPDGEENAAAERLRDLGFLKAACPDFTVRPLFSGLTLDQSVIDDAMRSIGMSAGSASCGRNCTIGVLDSGIDASLLPYQGALSSIQYDVDDPLDRGKAPSDPTGHGSLVAHIVNRIAPGARIISIKTFAHSGSVSGVLAGLYLSAAAGPCDLLNLSFGISCDPAKCPHCKRPVSATTNASQLEFFFQNFMRGADDCVLIAAAGNYSHDVMMPASFPGVVAVGDFDYHAQGPGATSASYHQVPMDRYLLAPGSTVAASFGSLPAHKPTQRKPLHGTSFATAFVTGVAARHICRLKGACSGPSPMPVMSLLSHLQTQLAAAADRAWSGYNRQQHGLGALRYP